MNSNKKIAIAVAKRVLVTAAVATVAMVIVKHFENKIDATYADES